MRLSLPVAKRKARIEIIPLIDIVFFLLATFVMVSLSMVKNQGVPVRLPSAATSVPEERRSAVTVTITEAGKLYLDKEAMPLEELKSRLASMHASDPELKIFVNGDEHAYFGQAVEILDEVRAMGIKKVSVQTKGRR